jgi:hypothetical protein
MVERRGETREPCPARTARASFTLRIWREADAIWRGQIVHVQTGQTAFFQDPARMWAFARACLGLREEEPFLGP